MIFVIALLVMILFVLAPELVLFLAGLAAGASVLAAVLILIAGVLV